MQEILKVKGFQGKLIVRTSYLYMLTVFAVVAPSELEGHLLDHPDVSDVCVVGIPDDYSGELPFAFVVPTTEAAQRAKASPAQVKSIKHAIMKVRACVTIEKEVIQTALPSAQHVSDHKVRYKWLSGVEFVESIPKNPSGKLLRRQLRDHAKDMLKREELVLMGPASRAKARL